MDARLKHELFCQGGFSRCQELVSMFVNTDWIVIVEIVSMVGCHWALLHNGAYNLNAVTCVPYQSAQDLGFL